MIGIIERYIAKYWIKFYLGSFFALTLLFTLAEFVNGLFRSREGGIIAIITLYLLKLPRVLSKVIPVCGMLASVLSIQSLIDHSELTAIFATGYRKASYFLLHVFLAFFILFFEYSVENNLGPFVNSLKKQFYNEKEYYQESKFIARSPLANGAIWFKSTDYFASYKNYDARNKTLSHLFIYQFNQDNKISQIIQAEKAQYSEGAWSLKKAKIFDHLSENESPPTLQEKPQMSFTLKESPEDFKNIDSDLDTFSLKHLYSFIQDLKEIGINVKEYESLFFEKIASILFCLAFTLVPLLSLENINKRGLSTGKTIAKYLLICIAIWAIHIPIASLGYQESLPMSLMTLLTPLSLIAFTSFRFYARN